MLHLKSKFLKNWGENIFGRLANSIKTQMVYHTSLEKQRHAHWEMSAKQQPEDPTGEKEKG